MSVPSSPQPYSCKYVSVCGLSIQERERERERVRNYHSEEVRLMVHPNESVLLHSLRISDFLKLSLSIFFFLCSREVIVSL